MPDLCRPRESENPENLSSKLSEISDPKRTK